jgi:hypothetical protein
MNQYKKTVTTDTEAASAAAPRKAGRFSDLSGLITKEQVMGWMPFVFFVTFLMLIYIWNSYYAEKNVREIDKISSELKELRSEYITSKSELMFKSKQSEVARELSAAGIKESVVPPKKIILKKEQN